MVNDLVRDLFDASLAGIQHDLGILGRLVGAVDAREVLDLPGTLSLCLMAVIWAPARRVPIFNR